MTKERMIKDLSWIVFHKEYADLDEKEMEVLLNHVKYLESSRKKVMGRVK